jgi:hypothetical protein
MAIRQFIRNRAVVPTMRKPFDILAEGLSSENSRGDITRLELFLAGIREWGIDLWRLLDICGVNLIMVNRTKTDRAK